MILYVGKIKYAYNIFIICELFHFASKSFSEEDLDLRVLPPPVNTNKRQTSEHMESTLVKKTKAEKFDAYVFYILFMLLPIYILLPIDNLKCFNFIDYLEMKTLIYEH